ncbi:phospholipase A1 [Nomia melanderi]|uniref:phospholipase A1 n=1 Tax=Nomia melanderi TaxID=2448451 RepID=UPI00130444B0|nr:pancreatic triacylglycerol lipase-like [Nomia melanderi]
MVAPAPLALLYPTLLNVLMQSNYTILPDENGVPILTKLDYQPLSLEEINVLAAEVQTITFTLFTRANPRNGQQLKTDVSSVWNSNWNGNKPTVIVTHGWKSAGTGSSCTLIRDAFLKVLDCNVIVVDWNQIAKNLMYSQVAKSVPEVANHVASFVNFMRTKSGLKTATLKLVGHSLGAHVASLTAQIVSKSSAVSEVIGLDPAKPMFEDNNANSRIDRSHAKNVQIIHTCAGLLGMRSAVGTSDFYANGGRNQPGCNNDMLGGCAHSRSYEYYSESITNTKAFPGTPQKGGATAYMGGPNLDSRARGSYDFKTGGQPPYTVAH